ncbi:MAG: hypothetical protein CK548_09660 [Opitutia bacterium]|nr:MAG: hypothetical protein CK548_09660 [Opitutae bacterium]
MSPRSLFSFVKFLLRFHRYLPWINLPVAALIALLQRTPLLRVVSAAESLAHASPVGHMLRSAFTTVASLGAVHALAGATQLVVSRTSVSGTVGAAVPVVAFAVSGSPASPGSYRVADLPPGVTITGVAANGIFNGSTGTLSGTPTASGTFLAAITAYQNAGGRGDAYGPTTVAFVIAPATPVTAVFSLQPASRTVAVGSNVTFTASASGTPSPTFQWRKDGVAIPAAVGVSFTLTNVQLGQAGAYSVAATNSAGTTVSELAILTVNVPAAISTQPVSQSLNAGTAATFTVAATGTAPLTYQWRKDGTPILGATNATLTLSSVQSSDAAAYAVVITNVAGSSTSSAAILAVIIPNSGRLINLSVLTDIATAGDDFTLGYVVGGSGSSGAKPLVIRAAGPSLGAFGVPGTLDDPKLELFAGSTKTSENDNWGGSPQLTAALAAVGAFAYTGPASKDAATTASITTRDNSVRVSAVGSGTGKVIAEIYDATPTASFTTATPRLINVSVRKHLGSGLTMGFVVGGATPAKVLVRGIGPTLGTFGVPGTVVDPQLTLFNSSSVKIGENNDWAGTAELTAAFASVGAFALPATSKDAALLVTLAPGNYTAQVTGVNGTTGVALVEVYEVP